MSIIYNNQVVAGKYTQQVVADADTVNAGIIKLATEEQVIEGVDNTTAITPFYLAQKQNKISAGDGIVIDNNEISCTVNPDEQTIVRKDNGTMQCIGQLTKSNTLKFDWEGTQAEYNVAYLNGTIQPDWYCYITDDESIVDYGDVANQSLSNLKQEGEDRFNNKANIDLDNLSSVGQSKLDIKADKATTLEGYGITDGLNKNQITNCLLEVPQNIKLELNEGTLTLKAGSVVIVPNGFETDGTTPKFEYHTVDSDISVNWASSSPNAIRMLYYINGKISVYQAHTSGTTAPTTGTNQIFYNTNTNSVDRYDNGSNVVQGHSFPFCKVKDDGSYICGSIEQVFNGMGYIGSIVWVDKGVKGLAPNGINEDGSLKNVEFTTSKILIVTNPANSAKNNLGICITSTTIARRDLNGIYSYKQEQNLFYESNLKTYFSECLCIVYDRDSNGKITSFQPKLAFQAVDYNDALLKSDKSEIIGYVMPSNKCIDLALGASGSSYTMPANGWLQCACTGTAGSTFFELTHNTISCCASFNGGWGRASMPVTKGMVIVVYYGGTNFAKQVFRFTYAQGEL